MLLLVVHLIVHLHNTYLTTFVAFSLTLNTISFEYSTLEWFENSTCMTFSVDLLPSFMQLRSSYRTSRDTRSLVQILKKYCNTNINFVLQHFFLKLMTLELSPYTSISTVHYSLSLHGYQLYVRWCISKFPVQTFISYSICFIETQFIAPSST